VRDSYNYKRTVTIKVDSKLRMYCSTIKLYLKSQYHYKMHLHTSCYRERKDGFHQRELLDWKEHLCFPFKQKYKRIREFRQ